MGATRDECQEVFAKIKARFPFLCLYIDDDFQNPGCCYINVIDDSFTKPDLSDLVREGWLISNWRMPDQRAVMCCIEKF